MSDDAPADEAKDRALVVGVARESDGDGLVVVRRRGLESEPELGLLRPLRQGRPIHGEVVKLTPRAETPLLCDVEVAVKAPPAPAQAHKGPARVATEGYRTGWDRIFAPPSPKDAPS